MPDREAVFGTPVEVGEVTLTPLVEVTRWRHKDPGGVACGGRLVPLGVLVEGPDGVEALDLDGQPLPLSAPRGEG